MGNAEAKVKSSKTSSTSSSLSGRAVDKRVEQAFVKLTGSTSNCLTFGNLKDVFNEGLAESLWNYLSDSQPYDGKLTFDEFARRAPGLWGTSTDVYVKACQPVLTLIKHCSEAAGAGAVTGDETFIGNLAREMCKRGTSVEDVVSWKHAMCPSLCNALRDLVLHGFLGYAYESVEYSSEILTPMQMWYVQCSLSGPFFPKKHSANRYGGSATVLFEISPELRSFSSSSPPIYCNFKIRSAAFGLSFLEKMKIDKEMSNVVAVEVWGCAPSSALQDQQRLRVWQSKQAEKIKKVPLPGNWDDNPDKTILEMAGFQFSNEKKLMEMEARAEQN